MLYQEIGGSQAEGPHHPAIKATGQDLLGRVKGHSTRHFVCSCEVIQLRGRDTLQAQSWIKLYLAATPNNKTASDLHRERDPQQKSDLASMDLKPSEILGLWAFR